MPDHVPTAAQPGPAPAKPKRRWWWWHYLLGTMFVAHALLKLLVFTLPGTAQFFASIGLPPALGYVVFAAELVGGALLIAGVYTRAVALALVPVLLGAVWAHAGNGWLFTNANGGWEYPLFLTVAALVQASIGDGAYALLPTRGFNPATRAALAR